MQAAVPSRNKMKGFWLNFISGAVSHQVIIIPISLISKWKMKLFSFLFQSKKKGGVQALPTTILF
jgi:hypothetical protein